MRIHICLYIYIGRVDKEDPEVVKWIWPSFEKDWKQTVKYIGWDGVPVFVLMSGRCGGEKGHPVVREGLVWCVGLCFKRVDGWLS